MKFTLLFILIGGCFQVYSQNLKVMTYNIRYDNTTDGVNQWANRKEKVAKVIRKHNPDLIGVQEALENQLRDLLLILPDYTAYGVARDDGREKGEYSAILVRHSRFGVLKDSTFWLSETPTEPGSIGWDASYPRVATWTKLYDRETKLDILYINSHFDHVGVAARNNSALILLEFLNDHYKQNPSPIIFSGDLNFQRDSETYKIFAESNLLIDSKPEKNTDPTFCGFEVSNTKCTQIDYIFYTKELRSTDYTVIRDNDGKHYPSDHLPILAEFEFTTIK